MYRSFAAAAAAVLLVGPLHAQVDLTEKVAPGDVARYTLELELKGNLIVTGEKGKQPIRLEARAKHVFADRVMAVTDNMASTSARYYQEASATAVLASEKTSRSLPSDRRLIVARRNPDGMVCYAAAGALTRDELDLVTEHFNPRSLPGLLPGKAVNVGDTWSITDVGTGAACLLDGVIKTTLVGKLTGVKDGVATFTVEGTAEGIETGAKTSLAVSATGRFDLAAGCVTELVWKQQDERQQGAVNPASLVEATMTLRRQPLAMRPTELSDEAVAMLEDATVPARATDLRQTEPRGRYHIVHARDWHVTGQTENHLVMRLVQKGEFVAQATVSVWKKMEPGSHTSIEDFKKAVASAPTWAPTKVVLDGEMPITGGKWLYRMTVEGKMEDVPVVQTFYLLAGPQGDQVAVTIAAKPDKFKALGTRDLELVQSIEFGQKK
jgi:hypothetical protein